MTGTGLRDDTTLGAIRLDWWAASDWNGARNTFGIPGRLRRNPQFVASRARPSAHTVISENSPSNTGVVPSAADWPQPNLALRPALPLISWSVTSSSRSTG